jgi:hypothetical protein
MDEFTTMTVIEKADLDAKIEELQKERDRQVGALDRALAQIERMLIERDGLRRELSEVIASYHGEDAVDIAVERGWNCFENCTQVEGEWLVNEGKA